MDGTLSIYLVPLLMFGAFLVYMIPAIIANRRNHESRNAICMLNLIFGWTLLGWGIALVWAFTGSARENAVA